MPKAFKALIAGFGECSIFPVSDVFEGKFKRTIWKFVSQDSQLGQVKVYHRATRQMIIDAFERELRPKLQAQNEHK